MVLHIEVSKNLIPKEKFYANWHAVLTHSPQITNIREV